MERIVEWISGSAHLCNGSPDPLVFKAVWCCILLTGQNDPSGSGDPLYIILFY